MAYYWYEQAGRHIASGTAAKFYLMWDGITIQRADSALVRILTPVEANEDLATAEARLQEVFRETIAVLPKYVPGR